MLRSVFSIKNPKKYPVSSEGGVVLSQITKSPKPYVKENEWFDWEKERKSPKPSKIITGDKFSKPTLIPINLITSDMIKMVVFYHHNEEGKGKYTIDKYTFKQIDENENRD